MRVKLIFVFSLFYLFTSAQTPDSLGVYKFAEQLPEYPGGLDSLIKEVTAKIVYPKSLADSNIQGKVYVQFVVNKDGGISNIKRFGNSHSAVKAAAVEAIEGTGKFKPGMQGGVPVKVYQTIPVVFKLEEIEIERGEIKSRVDLIEKMPEFPGGDEALRKWIEKNKVYPQDALKNEIEGKVIVSFVVTEDGSIKDAKIIRGVSPSLDRESLRVVNTFPKFIPGIQAGKPVKVHYNLPVIFRLP